MSCAKDIVASRIVPAWPHLLMAGQPARALKGGSVSSFKVIRRPRPGKDAKEQEIQTPPGSEGEGETGPVEPASAKAGRARRAPPAP